MAANLTNVAIQRKVDTLIRACKSREMSELRESDMTKYKSTIGSRHSDLKFDCPTLFDMIVEHPNEFDLSRFSDLLNRRNRFKTGQTTQQSEDARIGQDYFDEYVQPALRESRTHQVSEIDHENPVQSTRNDIASMLNINNDDEKNDAKSDDESDDESDDSESDDESDSDDEDESDSDESDSESDKPKIEKKTFKKEVIKLV